MLSALLIAGEVGLSNEELENAIGDGGSAVCKIGIGNCLKNRWARKDKGAGKLIAIVDTIATDDVREQLIKLKSASSSGGGG